jgi:hypothetical protein
MVNKQRKARVVNNNIKESGSCSINRIGSVVYMQFTPTWVDFLGTWIFFHFKFGPDICRFVSFSVYIYMSRVLLFRIKHADTVLLFVFSHNMLALIEEDSSF